MPEGDTIRRLADKIGRRFTGERCLRCVTRDPRLVGVARTLGCGPVRAFLRVTLPLARRGVLAGIVLAFSRALGEFGATVMVAGSIPGRTRTLALAIFQQHQVGHDAEAFRLVGITVVLAFVALWVAERVGRPR